jgi:hypothetical protein
MSPSTAQEWMNVARERAADVEALKQRLNPVGAVYMAGYAIECSLKAYLQMQGKGFPTSGSDGHNLKGLWRASGFRLGDLPDTAGEKTFYIEHWNTALRYESDYDFPIPSESLIEGAKELTGWIQNKIRRHSIHRRKKP